MSSVIQFKTTILPLLIVTVLTCFGLSPVVQAQLPSPSPDGGYFGNNTARAAVLFSGLGRPPNTPSFVISFHAKSGEIWLK